VCAAVLTAAGGLAEANILLSATAAGGLRLGTQAITRQGFTEAHMPAIAALITAVLHDGAAPDRVRPAVAALRSGGSDSP
jgi:glycine/serine hydroxymethyltransferase